MVRILRTLLAGVMLSGFVACSKQNAQQRGIAQKSTDHVTVLRKLLAENLGLKPEQVDPNKTLKDHGADELDFVELIMSAEEEFKVEIPEDPLTKEIDKLGAGTYENLTLKQLAKIIKDCAVPQKKDTGAK